MVFSVSVYFSVNDEFLNVNTNIVSQTFHGSSCASETAEFLHIYCIYPYQSGIT